MTEENGSIRVPTKEWLQRIDAKLEAIDLKLDMKANRESVHDHASRLAALELTSVSREGPLIQELRTFSQAVGVLKAERDMLIPEFRVLQSEVESLRFWRNRLVGALAVCTALFAAATAVLALASSHIHF